MGDVTGRAGELRPQQEPAAALKGVAAAGLIVQRVPSPGARPLPGGGGARCQALQVAAIGADAVGLCGPDPARPSASQRVQAGGGSVWLVLGTHPGAPFGVHSVLAVALGGAREEFVEGDDVALTPAGRLALEAAR